MTVMAHLGLVGAVTVNVTLQVGCVNKARQIGSLDALGPKHLLPGLSGFVAEPWLSGITIPPGRLQLLHYGDPTIPSKCTRFYWSHFP